MNITEIYGKTPREKRTIFFDVANKVGLVKDGHYIDGIPEGDKNDINFFYRLEDYLEYPKPCKIPKNYLPKN